jgi:hypothetical protein
MWKRPSSTKHSSDRDHVAWGIQHYSATQARNSSVRNGLNVGRTIERGVVGSSGAGGNILMELLVEK